MKDNKLIWQTESYIPVGDLKLAQELFDKGLIYFANRNLHLYGYAIGATIDIDGQSVLGINIHKTFDEDGIWFDEELEINGRRKLFGKTYEGNKIS